MEGGGNRRRKKKGEARFLFRHTQKKRGNLFNLNISAPSVFTFNSLIDGVGCMSTIIVNHLFFSYQVEWKNFGRNILNGALLEKQKILQDRLVVLKTCLISVWQVMSIIVLKGCLAVAAATQSAGLDHSAHDLHQTRKRIVLILH